MGDIDHGMCHSIYFAGPEGLVLEVATSSEAIDGDAWIDPEVVELYGMTGDDVSRYRNPEVYLGEGGSVAQPEIDPSKPHLAYPAEDYAKMMQTPDDVILKYASYPDPPNKPAAA